MVTVRTRKLGTCRLGKPHWNAGRRQTNVGTERLFLEGQSSPRSNAFRFEPRTPERWHSRGQVFPKPLEISRVSSWVSCICWSFWQLQSQPHWPRWCTLLEVGTAQSVDHCYVPCGAATRVPRQQRQTIGPLAVITNQPMWFLHVVRFIYWFIDLLIYLLNC